MVNYILRTVMSQGFTEVGRSNLMHYDHSWNEFYHSSVLLSDRNHTIHSQVMGLAFGAFDPLIALATTWSFPTNIGVHDGVEYR